MWEIYTRSFPYRDEHPIRVVSKITSGYRPAIPGDCPAAYSQVFYFVFENTQDNSPSVVLYHDFMFYINLFF
jgi:hypothetical protein